MTRRGQASLLTENSTESSLRSLEPEERDGDVTAPAAHSTCTERGCEDEGCSCECSSCSYTTGSSTIHDSDRSAEYSSGDTICDFDSTMYGSEPNSVDTPPSSIVARRSRTASCGHADSNGSVFDTDFSESMNNPDYSYSSSLSDGLSRRSSFSSETIDGRQVHDPIRRTRSSSVYSLATEALARELGRALEEARTPPPNPAPSDLFRLSAARPRARPQPVAFSYVPPPLPSLPRYPSGPGPAGRLVLPHPGGGSRRCTPWPQTPPRPSANSPEPSGQQPLPLTPRCPDDSDYDGDEETPRTSDSLDAELFGNTPGAESFRSSTPLPSERAWIMTPLPSERAQSPLLSPTRRRQVAQTRPSLLRSHLQRLRAKRSVAPPPDPDEEDEDEDSAVEYPSSEYIPESVANSDSENMSSESGVSEDMSEDRPKKRRKKR